MSAARIETAPPLPSRVRHSMPRPNPLVVRAYLARGARIWLAARASIVVTMLFANDDPFHLSPVANAYIVAVSVALGWADIARRRERALLENMGIEPVPLSACFAVPALVGEIAFLATVAALA